MKHVRMKKIIMVLMISCLLLTGCGILKGEVVTVNPLPDTTMENLTDAILSVSLEEGDAYVDDTGIFYAVDQTGAKIWYAVGEATIRVSVDFMGYDNIDPELGEVILYPGSFLINEVTNYNFTPYNTTIRVEAGQIVEMHRTYID